MRIRITEDQANRLNILNNGDNPVKLLNQYTKLKMDVIDQIYDTLVNLSISELMNPEFNLRGYEDVISGIEVGVRNYKESAFTFIGNDDEHEEEISEADMIPYDLERKLSGLDSMISSIGTLRNDLEDNEYLRMFKGNEPMDVTNM